MAGLAAAALNIDTEREYEAKFSDRVYARLLVHIDRKCIIDMQSASLCTVAAAQEKKSVELAYFASV